MLAALTVVLADAVPATAEPATLAQQHTGVPAYWSPATEPGMELFRRLAQHRPANEIVVLNGTRSGPQIPYDAAWARAVATVRESGATAIGYVDTGYFGFGLGSREPQATRPDGPGAGDTSVAAWTAQITHDIDQWHSLYGIGGIFLDQTIAECGTPSDPYAYVDLYAAITDYVSERYPDDHIVLNPGVPVEQCYDTVADTIVTFENTYAVYTDPSHPLNQTPAWQLAHPEPKKFWHLVYDAPSEADMRLAVAESKRRNAGYVYVTDDRLPVPWDSLPAYWDAELAVVDGRLDTSAPTRPTGLSGTARSGTATAQATLGWRSASDDVGVVGYEVAVTGAPSAFTVTNTVVVPGLAPDTAYSFRVRARDASGNLGRWSEAYSLTMPPRASAPILDASAYRTATAVHYRARYVDPFTHHRVFIDADDDPATGFTLPPGQPTGFDYMIENAVFYRYSGVAGAWSWTPVAGVAPLVSNVDGQYLWQVPANVFGSVAKRQVVVFQAASPEVYGPTLVVPAESDQCVRYR